MGKKKSQQTSSSSERAADPAEVSSTGAVAGSSRGTEDDTIQGYVVDVVEDELELLQVDLGDMIKMKQVLDESVSAALLEHIEEDYHWDNFKLWLMFAACVFAMVAQFAPLPFPESRPVLGFCGSAYFVLSGILQCITTFVDKDSILLSKPVAHGSAQKKIKNTDMAKYGLRVRSNLPRFSEWYTVILEFQLKDEDDKKKKAHCRVEQTWSVGQFFDKEGYFDEVGLSEEIDKLIKRFEDGKFDPEKKDDKKSKKD